MTNGIESLGRVRMQGIALLAIAFVVGVLVGVAGDRLLAGPEPPDRRPWRGPRGDRVHRIERADRGDRLPRFLRRLDLTAEQRDSVQAILEKYRPRTDSILRESMPRLRAIRDSAHAEIRDVLTREQRARIDSMLPPGRLRDRFGPGLGPRDRPHMRRGGPPGD